jgi:hypothetical protein
MTLNTPKLQSGGSALGNIILILLFAYGVYVGIQYVPQLIESKSLDSMLDSLESNNRAQKYTSAQEVQNAVKSMLNLNQMDDMNQYIRVRESGQGISVEIEYERELKLLFQDKVMKYTKIRDLN